MAQIIAIDFGSFSEPHGEMLLLKTPHTLNVGHRENVVELSFLFSSLVTGIHHGRNRYAVTWQRKVMDPSDPPADLGFYNTNFPDEMGSLFIVE